MFEQCDVDSSNGVHFGEFAVWLKVVRKKQGKEEASEKRARSMFRRADLDGDGTLSLAEFTLCQRSIYVPASPDKSSRHEKKSREAHFAFADPGCASAAESASASLLTCGHVPVDPQQAEALRAQLFAHFQNWQVQLSWATGVMNAAMRGASFDAQVVGQTLDTLQQVALSLQADGARLLPPDELSHLTVSLQQGAGMASAAFQQLHFLEARRSQAALPGGVLASGAPPAGLPAALSVPPQQEAGARRESREIDELEQMFASGPPSARRPGVRST